MNWLFLICFLAAVGNLYFHKKLIDILFAVGFAVVTVIYYIKEKSWRK